MTELSRAWTCPSCGRRVPPQVQECRCGCAQPEAPAAADANPITPVAPRGRRGLALVFLLFASAAIFALVARPAGNVAPVESLPARALEPMPAALPPQSGEPLLFVPPVVVHPGALDPRTASLPSAEAAPAPALPASLEDVVSNVVPAVVSITAGRSRGTGFYVRPDHVLTNVHVLDGQTSVDVISGETRRSARVVSTAPGVDLALLQVYNHDPRQPSLTLGTADGLRVGQEVIAVGSALGVLSNTVTRGIVSAMRNTGEVRLIQTDAAINPGNSGGPLVNRAGQVIGVNTLKVARGAESIGFAVAIDHARDLLSGQSRAAGQAPVAGLDTMLRAGGPSEGEQRREQGEAHYTAAIEWAARNGEQIDSYWARYAPSCVTSSRRAGDREWFAVYEPNGVAITAHSQVNCTQFLDMVQRNALQLKAEVDKASEAARRNGVYPGVMRDVRRRYRMDWPGWDR